MQLDHVFRPFRVGPFEVRRFISIIVSIVALASVSDGGSVPAQPNIVFILADDLGWADVAFHGGNTPTPHLDKLAREGLELTQHYVAATCSPTRAGLLSGRYWSRFGIKGSDNGRAFAADTVTLPRALKSRGYDTALMGKWHLGSKLEWGPNNFGFDHSYGSLAGGVGPYNHFYKQGEFSRTWHRNGKFVSEEGHVTDLIANEAVAWVAARKDAPFFLYLPFTAVHLPLKEPKAWLDQVPAGILGDVPRHYAASVMHLDDAVGQIVAALERAGKRNNTLFIFTSDNGGSTAENNDAHYPANDYPEGRLAGNNAPWRGQKGQLYDGGIRVATIASWPGILPRGNFSFPAQIVDWMPTLCALAGYTPEHDLKWDGLNLWPHLTDLSRKPAARALYWTTPRASAVRDGDWKLIVQADVAGKGVAKTELFDLAKDPHETTDLASAMPEKVASLQVRLATLARADGDAVAKN